MGLRSLIRSALLLLVIPAVLSAQETGSLTGRITDTEGGGLAAANITVTGPALTGPVGSVTDAEGQYAVPGLPPGAYEVRVSYIGYRTAVQTRVRVVAGRTRTLDVALEQTVIFLEQNVVSASRTQEKALDAPASIAVVESQEIRDRAALNVAEQIRDLPGVDFAKNGLVQSNTVIRGFNNIFSGAMLTLTDNRLARVPALRINVTNFIPATSDDIERIEVVLGPGSALYGPNSANGVMHIITRSPLTSEGVTAQIGVGERSLRRAAVRVASAITPELGVKISAQAYAGEDWHYLDPVEEAARAANPALKGRDFDISKQAIEARLDYRPSDDLLAIVSYGHNSGDYIELTGLGAAQTIDWTYDYVQTRVRYRGLFAQYYHNWNDSGDTYLLRTGEPMIDKSTLDVFQVQHTAELGGRQSFTYGVDALFTRPDTEESIYGQNEDDDNIDEFGVYLQSETDLTERLDLVLALRYDTHNRLDDPVFSPRAALLYKPTATQALRATYNRAFSTPTTVNLYLDLLTGADPFGLKSSFGPVLGFEPQIDVRAQGTYRDGFDEGFTFRRSADGLPMYRTPFAPVLAGQLQALGLSPGSDAYSMDEEGFIALSDPVATGVMWGIARGAVLNGIAPVFEGLATQQLIAAGVPADVAAAQAAALAANLGVLLPQQLPGLSMAMASLNLETRGFDPVIDAVDVPRTQPTITQTLELGYKGVVGGNLVVAVDVYRTDVEDFVGPLAIETPNVFLNPVALAAALQPAVEQALAAPENALLAAAVTAVDNPAIGLGGDGDGNAAQEFTSLVVNGAMGSPGAGGIPFGTVSPEQAYDPNAILLTYRNYGDVTHYGLDLSLGYYPTDALSLTANYSWVSKNFFEDVAGEEIGGDLDNVALNAPKHKLKLGAVYRLPQLGLRLGSRVRYNGDFRMESGEYAGEVDSYTLLDLSLAYDLPVYEGLSVLINVDNALDNEYRSFIGVPKIGRLAYVQLGASF